MNEIISDFLSWPFAGGLVAGFVLSRIWEVVKVCRLDKRKPLPNGKRRSKWQAIAIDPRWLSGLIAVLFLGWSVYTTQENTTENQRIAADAKVFAEKVRDCQRHLIIAINANRSITAEYNQQSAAQRDALSDWLRTLLDPPPEIAKLDGGDPVRQAWAVSITRSYFDFIQSSKQQQAVTDASRPRYPDPNCS